MILNSKTIALDYGSNPKIIKFGAKDVSELKTLFDTTYSLVNSLEQNLNILDTDIMTPDVVKSFSAAIRHLSRYRGGVCRQRPDGVGRITAGCPDWQTHTPGIGCGRL